MFSVFRDASYCGGTGAMGGGFGYLPSTQAGEFDCCGYKDTRSHGLVTKSWSTIYGFYRVYLTFTYKPHYKKECRKIELKNKLKVAFTVFSTFDMIEEGEPKGLGDISDQ